MIESEKETCPTMERPSKEGREATEELQQKFNRLQQQLDSLKEQSKPRTLRRSSTDSTAAMTRALQLLDNSPRTLMSSLQLGRSPSGRWNVRNNDLAVEEILRERRAAIANGKEKGRRRLFDEEVEDGEVNYEMGSDREGREEMITFGNGWGDDFVDEEREVTRSVYCYHFDYDDDDEKENVGSQNVGASPVCSSSSSFVCDKCMKKEIMEVEEGERMALVAANYGRRWTVVMVCLAIGLILCVVVSISIRSLGGHGINGYSKAIPVPT